jgi:hypothetical protein
MTADPFSSYERKTVGEQQCSIVGLRYTQPSQDERTSAETDANNAVLRRRGPAAGAGGSAGRRLLAQPEPAGPQASRAVGERGAGAGAAAGRAQLPPAGPAPAALSA